jgi:DNA modification methylase
MGVVIHHGDSREVLKGIPDNSIDSIVTDPPYALVSIVQRFGGEGAAPAQGDVYARASAGFMGQTWDTGETAFDPTFWTEVLRVLKPGGHIVAASGTRTYHRLAVAIEDAGFEIRDMISWLYGSGFPKSHDVSKGIDKAAGNEREVIRERYTAKRIKPGATVVAEGGYGKQDISFTATDTAPGSPESAEWQGWGTALKPACEPWVLARKPLVGTVAANVLAHGTGALNIDGCRIAAPEGLTTGGQGGRSPNFMDAARGLGKLARSEAHQQGRWPANVLHDGSDEVISAFPNAPGQLRAVTGEERSKITANVYGDFGSTGEGAVPRLEVDKSAARFFYSAKADAEDRVFTCTACDIRFIGKPQCACRDPEDNTKPAPISSHPTVKPIDLMQYLCRLITPPGGTILDPFAGTGTTGTAARREGFECILIEREATYVKDIECRLERAEQVSLLAFL